MYFEVCVCGGGGGIYVICCSRFYLVYILEFFYFVSGSKLMLYFVRTDTDYLDLALHRHLILLLHTHIDNLDLTLYRYLIILLDTHTDKPDWTLYRHLILLLHTHIDNLDLTLYRYLIILLDTHIDNPDFTLYSYLTTLQNKSSKMPKRKVNTQFWKNSPVYKKQVLLSEVKDLGASSLDFNSKLAEKKEDLATIQVSIDAAAYERNELFQENIKLKTDFENMKNDFDTFKILFEQKAYSKSQRGYNPTTWAMIPSANSTRYVRHNETKDVLTHIHGGTDGPLYGAWDFVKRAASPEQTETFVIDYKRGKWLEKLYGNFSTIYSKSEAGINQAIAKKYNLYLSRRKYSFMCKIQAATFDADSQSWEKKSIDYGDRNIALIEKSVSHDVVRNFVDKLDIGEIHSLPGYCGAFRSVTALTTMIIDLHLKTPRLREKLVWYNNIPNHFIMQFSDDGAPETRELTMCIGSLTCWNFGSRVRSRSFHYPLHTISTTEKDVVVGELWMQHADEMQLIEGNLLYINGEKVTIEFQPSADQAWQFWANNELTQSATYPSMFAKVHKSELSYIGGSIGTDTTDKWAVPNKESREIDLALLEIKRNELAEKNLSPQNFHRKELEFMAEKGLRQLGPPRIGLFADRQRPDPLHLEVNNWSHILSMIYREAVLHDNFEVFCKLLSLPVRSGGCGLKPICPMIKEHYNHDKFKKLTVRLIGAQAIKLSKYSLRLVDALKQGCQGKYSNIKFITISKICERLRVVGAIMNSVTCDNTSIKRLSDACKNYFNLMSLFFNDLCNSTIWTIGYVIPYHAALLYKTYGVGYGILSMQGKESKHSA